MKDRGGDDNSTAFMIARHTRPFVIEMCGVATHHGSLQPFSAYVDDVDETDQIVVLLTRIRQRELRNP